VPENETEFNKLVNEEWDTILLYDYGIPINCPEYPEYYKEILTSFKFPGYSIEVLWIDEESYALKMEKEIHS
jgi:hypothetical protein